MKFLKLVTLLIITANVYAQSNNTYQYFRHLRHNHVSPYIDLDGTYPIDKETAQTTSHYLFQYDQSGRIIEIINNHYHTERQHPLASLGVYKVEIKYNKNQEIRVYYDKNKKRISNDREVFKEVFSFDKDGFKNKLQFYDTENNPMESNWGISEYYWSKHKKLIIEKRYNLEKAAVALSPYFQFGTTGILLNKKGFPIAHYNLDDNFKVIANDKGTASYKDIYDKNGNHAVYSYHDADDALITNQWGFAYAEKKYDSIGNHIGLSQFDVNKRKIRGGDIPNNVRIELASKASKKDSTEIKRISLGYLVALQDLKPNLMNEVMNDSLNKLTIGWDPKMKKEYARATTKTQMIEFATSWNKSNTKFPFKPSNNIEILDIYNRIATVKLVSDNWVEYLHLMKLDGKWSIVNLVWQYKDIKSYPKE